MPPILKVLQAYLVLAGLTVVGLVSWRIAAAYSWERLGDGDETMMPSLKPAQVIRVDRTVRPEAFRRGMLVAYVKDPGKPDGVGVGRIVGLPGDRVSILKGEVRVNGEPSSDGLSNKVTDGEIPEIVVPRGTLFLLVDLRSGWQLGHARDADSRYLGPVSTGRVLGQVVL